MEAPVEKPAGAMRALAIGRIIMLTVSYALLVQFLLGITVNLYVKIPGVHPGAHAADYLTGLLPVIGWAIAREWPWIALHVTLGLLLVLSSIVAFPQAWRSGLTSVRVVSVIGLLAPLSAALNGAAFLMYNNDVFSMLMAASFAVALGAVILRLFMMRPAPATAR